EFKCSVPMFLHLSATAAFGNFFGAVPVDAEVPPFNCAIIYDSSASALASAVISLTAAAPPRLAMKCLLSIWIISVLLCHFALALHTSAPTPFTFRSVLRELHCRSRLGWTVKVNTKNSGPDGLCWDRAQHFTWTIMQRVLQGEPVADIVC